MATPRGSRPLALRAGRLIDGTGAAAIAPAVVVLRGETIDAAGPADRVVVPEDAEVRDLPGATVLPGLMDLHVHLRSGASDEYVSEVIASLWSRRDDRYSELRTLGTQAIPKIEMSYIGG